MNEMGVVSSDNVPLLEGFAFVYQGVSPQSVLLWKHTGIRARGCQQLLGYYKCASQDWVIVLA